MSLPLQSTSICSRLYRSTDARRTFSSNSNNRRLSRARQCRVEIREAAEALAQEPVKPPSRLGCLEQ